VGDFDGENRYMRRILDGNEINGGELPFLSLTPWACSTFRAFLFVRSLRTRLGKPGMAWVHRMDESSNPGENEEPRTRVRRISSSK
jgi:hypothetical protein